MRGRSLRRCPQIASLLSCQCFSISRSMRVRVCPFSTFRLVYSRTDLAQDANTVMTFYAASVGQLVHDGYQSPSLPRLGQHLLHTLCTFSDDYSYHGLCISTVGAASDVRHAARLLFDAGVARFSDQETAEMVESWQQYLPSTRRERERDWTQSALALCICGFIAVEKYALLPTAYVPLRSVEGIYSL